MTAMNESKNPSTRIDTLTARFLRLYEYLLLHPDAVWPHEHVSAALGSPAIPVAVVSEDLMRQLRCAAISYNPEQRVWVYDLERKRLNLPPADLTAADYQEQADWYARKEPLQTPAGPLATIAESP